MILMSCDEVICVCDEGSLSLLWSDTEVGQTNIVLTSRQGLIRGGGASSLTLINLIPRRSNLARENSWNDFPGRDISLVNRRKQLTESKRLKIAFR